MTWLNTISLPGLGGLVEILCLAAMFYYILFFFRGTRAAPTLAGMAFLFFSLILVTRIFHLDALNWILQRFSMYLAVAILVIFQPEIRRALAELGKRYLPGSSTTNITILDDVVKAVLIMAQRRVGALIAIEHEIGTRAIQESGVKTDAILTPELLASIFFPYTPLHDGGAIISQNRIVAARCIFPLSQRTEFSRTLGTRHRAAIGLTEETDAIVIVVSEETGKIACCHKGRIYQELDENKLKHFLSNVLLKQKNNARSSIWKRKFFSRVS